MTKMSQMLVCARKYTAKKAHANRDQINTETVVNNHRFPHHRAEKISITMQQTGTAAKKVTQDQDGTDSTNPKEKYTMVAMSHTVTADIPVIMARFLRFLRESGAAAG